ncbi:MAG: S41 family peptidase [Candidatus Moranbacteria bacterium]|nr:S41 family peptidase [Candidatus Moranbacteria bacterium]
MEMNTKENNAGPRRVSRKSQLVPLIVMILLMTGSFWVGFERGAQKACVAKDASSASDAVVSPQGAFILNKNDDHAVDFSLFWKSWDLLKDKYVDRAKLDANEMMYGAIKGMLASTGDPYTTFFDPKENKEFQEEMTGSFQGIGAEIGMKDNVLTIVAPLDDSPAQKAGLQAGDKILKIDDVTTMDMDLNKAVSLIRGEKGTEVKLTIFRNGSDEQTKEVSVKRDVISVKSVKTEVRDDGIAVIKVSRFGDDTAEAFNQAIADVAAKKSRGLILDLRNNPGGYLDAAVSMASLMLPEDKVVVMEENSKGDRKKMYAKGGDKVSGIETVVLINEGSASASEILAGALQDNRANVTLIGKKSFGKGSVQELVPVTKDTSVKITVARWLTPNGKQINHEGIAPSVDIEISEDDRKAQKDPQFDKAVEVLQEKMQ